MENKPSKVQKTVAAILAAAFLCAIFGFAGHALATNGKAIAKSVFYRKAKKYLADTENYDVFEMTSARIASLQKTLEKSVPLNEELTYVNATMQRAIGRERVVQGNQTLLWLNGGGKRQLYKMTSTPTLADCAQEIVDFRDALGADVPFLFCFVTAKLHEGGDIALPPEYAAFDTALQLADEVTGITRAAGIETLDSRTFFTDGPYAISDLYYTTDGHWNNRANILFADILAQKISEMTGVSLDRSRITLDKFTPVTKENYFFGNYAQDVGQWNIAPEDFTYFLPDAPTNIHHEWTSDLHEDFSADGPFEKSCVHWDMVDNGETPNTTAFADYGLVEYRDYYRNLGDCAKLKIFIIRDSYTAPSGAFLSLMASEVLTYDLRTADKDTHALDLVREFDPDIVIVSLSRQMMELHTYSLY